MLFLGNDDLRDCRSDLVGGMRISFCKAFVCQRRHQVLESERNDSNQQVDGPRQEIAKKSSSFTSKARHEILHTSDALEPYIYP